MKKSLILSLIIILICNLPILVSAQPAPPCTNPDDPSCSIDSGLITLLFTGGVYYLMKELRNKGYKEFL